MGTSSRNICSQGGADLKPIVFVTGASGFIGRHLCMAWIQAGFQVHALVRREDLPLRRAGVRLWIGDLWQEEVLCSALMDVSIVIHCAGDAVFGNGPQYDRANVRLTEYLVQAVGKYVPRIDRFVFISTIGAVDRSPNDPCTGPLHEETIPCPTSDYGRSKLKAEAIVRTSGLPYTILRPAMVVGADMRVDSHFAVFARNALSRSLMSRFAWPGSLSVIHVDDLAAAILLGSTREEATGKTFFGAGEAIAVRDFFQQCLPGVWRIPMGWAVKPVLLFRRWIPFSLKVMLLPALTASDTVLHSIGWRPKYSSTTALLEVIQREKARIDPEQDPGGQSVITGAASGLGLAMVERIAARRKHLLLIDRDKEGLAKVAIRFPHCRTCCVDLAVESELNELLEGEQWNSYPVTELFACAGLGLRGKVQDLSLESQKDILRVNVLARLTLAHRAMKDMSRGKFGRVVFISSSSAFQPLPYMACYAAANSALLSLGEAWSSEVVDHGIQLMTVCPGGMQTNFQRSAGVKELSGEKLLLPGEVAEAILNGLKRKRTTLIVSFRSWCMSLLARCLPRKVSVRLWHQLMAKMR